VTQEKIMMKLFNKPLNKFDLGIIFFVLISAIVFTFGFGIKTASTQTVVNNDPPPPLGNPIPSNADCLECHQEPDMLMQLPSHEELNLTVDRISYNTSIHGREGYACIQCHTDIDGFPHPERTAQTLRDVSIQYNTICLDCHTAESEEYAKGQHAQELILGNEDSALCIDCHGSHQTKELSVSDIEIIQTCRNCHSTIYDVYQNSVHGNALLEESNQDVPGCIDCHSSHENHGPSDHEYTLFSPLICAECHSDEKLMDKYDINTDVFDTYLSDFHGSTISIFEKIAPGQETNKPVCSDCHGVHNILSPEDENSLVLKENLVITCQRCHPDANTEFSDAWMSHYPPDLQHNTLVYLVELFYKIIIPFTIGGMLLYIATDVWKRSKGNSNHENGDH
jgi:hypothetical protein